MKIYSIKEIIKATNRILDDDFKNDNTNKIQTIDKELPPNIEDIIKDAETFLISKKKIEINRNVTHRRGARGSWHRACGQRVPCSPSTNY